MKKFYTTYEEAQTLTKLGLRPETASMTYYPEHHSEVSIEVGAKMTPALSPYTSIKTLRTVYEREFSKAADFLDKYEPCWTMADLLGVIDKYNLVKPDANSNRVTIMGKTQDQYDEDSDAFNAIYNLVKYMLATLDIDEQYFDERQVITSFNNEPV